MFKIIMSTGLLAVSTMSFASEVSQVFSDQDMQQQGDSYELTIYPTVLTNAAVIELNLNMQSKGKLTSEMQSVCTQWQGELCTGPNKDIWYSEFLHEVNLTLHCDDKILYQERKNNSEFTNEEITNLNSSISFNKNLITVNPVSCSAIKLNLQTFHGDKTAIIEGSISLKNSTSDSINSNYELVK
ncbi:hypothetical protein [Pseudoalteromonas tunicata]|uniref:Orphan protein n=1 Tax=Pseudoalteromonas tunicata D2 TaxID=87626 RepID=A4CF74_9GAMM|nr:hypothetical protein [Pseudoalteromonas tunicata]ATC96220.1 hypothetical protein PTUN_a3974 [Pseudoalteromonas tunicata]AXT31736.1 hypothetical protein D1819_13495 [Pseudoalteromonas tunicata]EAR26622.1 hypothetical protein PTD2_00397 [Pseudoalteromonas tunicata D2]